MLRLSANIFLCLATLWSSHITSTVDPEELSECLTQKGWIMYGSTDCSACSTQRSYFGASMRNINTVDCHPSAPTREIEQCIARRINYTPTWLLLVNGSERLRLEGYQSLDELAYASGCG